MRTVAARARAKRVGERERAGRGRTSPRAGRRECPAGATAARPSASRNCTSRPSNIVTACGAPEMYTPVAAAGHAPTYSTVVSWVSALPIRNGSFSSCAGTTVSSTGSAGRPRERDRVAVGRRGAEDGGRRAELGADRQRDAERRRGRCRVDRRAEPERGERRGARARRGRRRRRHGRAAASRRAGCRRPTPAASSRSWSEAATAVAAISSSATNASTSGRTRRRLGAAASGSAIRASTTGATSATGSASSRRPRARSARVSSCSLMRAPSGSATRRRASAREVRDLTVPRRTPSTDAVSSSPRSSTNRQTSTSCSSGSQRGERRGERPRADARERGLLGRLRLAGRGTEGGGPVDKRRRALGGPAPAARLVGDDRQQPGAERASLVEPRQRPVGLHERLLDGILGVGRRAGQRGHAQGDALVAADERGIGVTVAASGTADEEGVIRMVLGLGHGLGRSYAAAAVTGSQSLM